MNFAVKNRAKAELATPRILQMNRIRACDRNIGCPVLLQDYPWGSLCHCKFPANI
jgi:hypothetical protein